MTATVKRVELLFLPSLLQNTVNRRRACFREKTDGWKLRRAKGPSLLFPSIQSAKIALFPGHYKSWEIWLSFFLRRDIAERNLRDIVIEGRKENRDLLSKLTTGRYGWSYHPYTLNIHEMDKSTSNKEKHQYLCDYQLKLLVRYNTEFNHDTYKYVKEKQKLFKSFLCSLNTRLYTHARGSWSFNVHPFYFIRT